MREYTLDGPASEGMRGFDECRRPLLGQFVDQG